MDLYMNFNPGSADPWITFNAFFGPDSIWFPGDAPGAVAELMDAAEAEADQEARVPIFQELAQAVDDESLVVVISHPQRPVIANADITGFQGNVFGVPQLRGMGRAAE
jgi:ABC-type transport system substrate-binding protein